MTKKRGKSKKHDQRDVRALPAGQAEAYAKLQLQLGAIRAKTR